MKHKGEKKYDITFSRSITQLDKVRHKIAKFLSKDHVSVEVIASVELAVYELLINIVEHTSPVYAEENIVLQILHNHKTITIKIDYTADEFDLTKIELPDIKKHFAKGKRSGLGIYIIRKLMDTVTYNFKNGVNHVIMTRNCE